MGIGSIILSLVGGMVLVTGTACGAAKLVNTSKTKKSCETMTCENSTKPNTISDTNQESSVSNPLPSSAYTWICKPISRTILKVGELPSGVCCGTQISFVNNKNVECMGWTLTHKDLITPLDELLQTKYYRFFNSETWKSRGDAKAKICVLYKSHQNLLEMPQFSSSEFEKCGKIFNNIPHKKLEDFLIDDCGIPGELGPEDKISIMICI